MGRFVKAVTLVVVLAMWLDGYGVHAESATTAGHPAASDANPTGGVLYCSDLKQVTAFAATRGRFSPIAGKSLSGNFLETTLPLTGWRSCALYGTATYTCDADSLAQLDEAVRRRVDIVREIIACLGEDWAKDQERSAAGYTVVHPTAGPASIALSIDQDDGGRYIVRFTLFLRTSRVRE